MIKLIASDMDGTLLDEHSQVPPETYDLILGLREHGVRFAVSSGRRYDTLCEFFAPVIDQMDFVASNGAQVYVDGRMVDREVFSHSAILRLEEIIRFFDCLHLVLFDRTSSFCLMTLRYTSVRLIKTCRAHAVSTKLLVQKSIFSKLQSTAMTMTRPWIWHMH